MLLPATTTLYQEWNTNDTEYADYHARRDRYVLIDPTDKLAATSAREAELSRETVPGWLGISTAKGGIFGK